MELKGIVLVVVLSLLIWLSIGIYQKKFTDTVPIVVHTQRAGLQLNNNGDVRMRGALVGRVDGIQQHAGEALVHIELDAKQAGHIPADVRARIMPTTLFGQKYVELVAPDGTTSGGLVQPGAQISEDRSASVVEITDAFDHLEPLLTAVRPQDLSATLQAMAQALDGRGQKLGRLTVEADQMLARFEGHIPVLIDDLRLLARVSNTYAQAMPNLLKVLHNSTVTGKTVIDQESHLETFLTDVTKLSKTGERFLKRDGDELVAAGKASRPLLELLAKFAPEFPCLIVGLVEANKRFNSAFYSNKLNSRTVLPPQYPGYAEPDKPNFSDLRTGPNCANGGLPYLRGPLSVPNFPDGGRYPAGQLVVP